MISNRFFISSFQNNPISRIISSKQDVIDNLIGYSEIDQGWATVSSTSGEGGVYTDESFTSECTNLTDAVAFKGFGQNQWNVPNLFIDDNGSKARMWFNNESSEGISQLVDRGQGYRYVRVHNGPGMRWTTDPGQISPTFTDPVDIIQVHRVGHGANNEVDGFLKYVSLTSNWELAFGGAFQTTNQFKPIYELVYTRVTVDASGNWELRFNDLDKVSPDASGTGYTFSQSEHNIGSNGHPVEFQLFCRVMKFGAFSAQALLDLQGYFESLWSLGYPSYPYDTGTGISWNNSTNTWTVNEGTFGGGNGVKGTYDYEWWYWNSNDDKENFFSTTEANGYLDQLKRIDGQTGNTLDRDAIPEIYKGGARWGNGDIYLYCIRTPKDSIGNVGEKLSSFYVTDSNAGTPGNVLGGLNYTFQTQTVPIGVQGSTAVAEIPNSAVGANVSFSVVSGSLPSYMNLNSTTGALTYTGNVTGTAGVPDVFTVRASGTGSYAGSTADVVITINKLAASSERIVKIDLGSINNQTNLESDGWYNNAVGEAIGVKVTDCLDTNGNPTGLQVEVTDAFANDTLQQNRDYGAGLPPTINASGLTTTSANNGTIRISGFSVSQAITKIIAYGFSYSTGSPTNLGTRITFDGTTRDYNPANNNSLASVNSGSTNGAAHFDSVTADGSGNVDITVGPTPTDTIGIINYLEIRY